MKPQKVHLLFEQSGTFKNEFIKLGIPAYDYDIQNNFNQTDYQIDLFNEIEQAYDNKPSIFDSIRGGQNGDLIMAFFPCIYFESVQMCYYQLTSQNQKHMTMTEKIDNVLDRLQKRNYFHIILYKLVGVIYNRQISMILENPYHETTFLATQNFQNPTMIDKDRSLRGDVFRKPTAYWFFNCEPTQGFTLQRDKKVKAVKKCKRVKQAGLCSEERSMIHPDYARNFICDHILGIKQQNIETQLSLF